MIRLAVPVPALALLVASVFIAAACGEGTPNQATPTVPPGETPEVTTQVTPAVTASSIIPSPTATASPTVIPFEGTRGPVEEDGTAPVPTGALLVDVRTARHEGFDRIVFEFEEGLPGYRIEYVEPPIAGGPSGLPVEVEGSAFLRVTFRNAAGHDHSTGELTYGGSSEIAAGLPSLVELELAEDIEGVLAWALGLAEEVDFRVSTLETPFRVVIDVAHP